MEKNPDAVALGRLGGKKGGLARAARLTPARRSEIAREAAQVRWGAKVERAAPSLTTPWYYISVIGDLKRRRADVETAIVALTAVEYLAGNGGE